MGNTGLNCPLPVALETLGCKLNQAETEKLAAELVMAGCRIVPFDQAAGLYIINTCTVTHIADRKSRHLIRLAHRLNPSARIVVIGCFAERAPEELTAIDGVDLVVGNSQKNRLVHILNSAGYLHRAEEGAQSNLHNRTRSFISAQDGCNQTCSYCIVPLVRGSEKSASAEQVVNEVNKRVASGFREIVLTGTEIGSYYSCGLRIRGLLERILQETDVTRLRLSSLQPEEITPDLISLWEDPRLCRHFHISLQSGCDEILQRMNRRYSVNLYQEKIAYLRVSLRDVAITTDVIVGFPGETEADFEESYATCRRIKFSRLHIFPFSARRGTTAFDMPGQISPSEKKQRSRRMLALAVESMKEFNSSFIGRTLEVLFEQDAGSYYTGLTGNYIKVYVPTGPGLNNKVLPVKMHQNYRDGTLGEVLK